MLKYLNEEQTEVSFFGSTFELSEPGDFSTIGDGPTRSRVQDWLDAGNSPQPFVLDSAIEIRAQIGKLEASMVSILGKALITGDTTELYAIQGQIDALKASL